MKNIITIFTAILLLGACSSKKEKETAAVDTNLVSLTDIQMKNSGITTGTVIEKRISATLKANGRIDVPPQSMVSISVPLGGYLKNTKLLPGLHVNKGEIIAVIEDNQYIQLQQDYLTAKAQFIFNESEYNRQKELNASKATSDKVYEQAKSVYHTQRILIRSLAEKLKMIGISPTKLTENNISKSINVYAPIDGFVSKVYVNIGKYVTPADVLFELVNPRDIHLALKIFEKDLSKISIGQQVFSFTNSNPTKRHEGDIILISKDVTSDGTVEVHCHFDKYDQSLFPGMYMNAEIELKSELHQVLPNDAIVRFEGKEYVYEVKGKNTFEMLQVEIGIAEGGFTEVISKVDLKNKQLVIKGAYTLLMKMKNMEEE